MSACVSLVGNYLSLCLCIGYKFERSCAKRDEKREEGEERGMLIRKKGKRVLWCDKQEKEIDVLPVA